MPGKGKKIKKIAGWFLLAICALLVAAIIFVWIKAPVYLEKNLSETVAKKTNGMYRLAFDDIRLKWFPFSVYFEHFELQANKPSANNDQPDSGGKAVYRFRSPEIQFSNIDLIRIFRRKVLKCGKITVVKPELQLTGEEIFTQDSTRSFKSLFTEMRPLFETYIKRISIGSIEFVDAKYGLSNITGNATQISKAENISVKILNFTTDSTMIFSNENPFETEDVLVKMNNFHNHMGDSLHVVKIDTLEYSLKNTNIRAAGFHLTATGQNSDKNVYNVHVPNIYVKSKSITHFAFSDSISIKMLKFEHPQIKFYQKENPKKIKIQELNNFDLYPLIQNDFSKIEVDSFYLHDANIEIYRQPDTLKYQQRFESVDVSLLGFELDSLSAQNPEKLLHADDLSMNVSGYHLRLEDNEHDFTADSLFVSTFKNSLGAKNIRVLPADSLKINTRVVVNIQSKGLEINDVNLKELYHTRILPTSKIEITAPKVNLQYRIDRPKSPNQQEAGLLFDLVSAYLKGVYSNLVFIDNGVLNIKNLYNNNVQGYFETRFSFSLTDFSLDSASIKRTDKFFYATNFDLHFSDYQMKLVDDFHKLNVDSVFISSINQQVHIQNLHLQPAIKRVTADIMEKYNRSELYNIYVPNIDLQGVDLRNAFFHNKLSIKNFRISNPDIYFENFNALRVGKTKKEFTEFYQLIFNYMNDFDIKKIAVPDGEITWVNHTKKGKTTSFDNEFSATLENFKLNEEELDKKRLLFSDNFDISIKDQLFQLSDSVHILRAGEISLSTAKSSINIKDALLYPAIASDNYNDLSTTYQVSIPDLKISNFDFLKAYYSRDLRLNRLDINHPKFQIYSQPDAQKSLDLNKYKFLLPAFIKSLQINEFKINDGEVTTYETHGINHQAKSSFKVDLVMPNLTVKNANNQAEFSSANFILNINSFKTPLGKMHNLSVGKIGFNREQKLITVEQLEVDPFLPKKTDNHFKIVAPQIQFTGFDVNEALEKNSFSFGSIDIQHPQIEIEINDSVREDKLDFLQNLDLYPFAEPFVDEIKVANLGLNQANINFNWLEKQLIDKKINLNFKDILIAENQPPSNLLNSREFEITTSGIRKKSKDNLYEYLADSFIYNSAQHSILLKNLSIHPLVEKEQIPREKGFQTDVVNATIATAGLEGIDEKRWLKENVLDAELLKIGNVDLHIFRDKRYQFNENQRPPWPQDLIKKIKQPFVFDSLILAPSHIKYSELIGFSGSPGIIEFNDLQFHAGEISNIDSITNQYKNFKIVASAELLDQAQISATVNFDLTDKNYTHTISGSMGKMPLPPLNSMIENTAPVSIESGSIDRFDFEISLNKDHAVGWLDFGYENFKIAVLKYDDEEIKKSKFATFWANNMVLNSKNNTGNSDKPDEIYYERDPQRSIINYWWKSIYSGAKKTLGIDDGD